MLINVIGLGYIGLPTSLILSANGHKVIGTDINEEIVHSLNNGKITFKEKGLEDLFEESLENDIQFTTKYIPSDVYIVTVPTPYLEKEKKLDNRFLISAVSKIMDIIDRDIVLIIESTVSPGTINKVIRPLTESSNYKISLAHAPERILPGNMVEELYTNSRTIGADDYEVAEKVKEIYSSFAKGEMIITDIATAEMTKVIENTYRDVNIAFANEVANICHKANLDVVEVISIANKHPRVNILYPGPGVGGHCIPVDPWFLISEYQDVTELIKLSREINEKRPQKVAKKIIELKNKESISDDQIGIYGLSYKENVGDVRESPTLQLINYLESKSITKFKVYDPLIEHHVVSQQVFDEREFFEKLEVLIIMVYHDSLYLNELSDKIIVIDTKYKLQNKDYSFYIEQI